MSEARVGIFWSYENKLFHYESSPLSEGVKTRVSIDYEVGHYAAWFIMAKRGLLDKLPKNLRAEYDSIPRGRVVYLLKKEKFVVYHGDEFDDDQYNKLKELFNLPQDKTIERIDMHYNPLPDDFTF
ncbi:MAG: hypothetical protein PQJ59_10525 [Spirochaetales bacterium]|nr:hypothetical protein [Spirochaetales bacterium]